MKLAVIGLWLFFVVSVIFFVILARKSARVVEKSPKNMTKEEKLLKKMLR